jgi:glycosyltransferase involved in cell wall biosynthesis
MVKIKDDPKVVAVMPVWGRPSVLRIVLKMIPSWVSGISFVISPEDRYYEDLLSVINEYEGDCKVSPHINRPLASKLNHGVRKALTYYQFDYLMNIGSDDIVHEGLLKAYRKELIKRGYKEWPTNTMMGCNSGDWVSFDKQQAYRIKYFDVPIIIGAGRFTSRDIVEKCSGLMNDPERHRGLDTNSQIKAQQAYNIDALQFELGGYVIDIKTSTNLNKFEILETSDILREPLTMRQVRERYGIYMEGVE